jgi:hypothetical protein
MVLLLLQSNVVTGQTSGSQILMARNAKLIIIGEVEYLAKRPPTITTAAHVDYQTVVYRVHEVLKGTYTEKLMKVGIGVALDNPGLPESIFRKETKFILILERQEDEEDCYEQIWESFAEFKTPPEFKKYEKLPCFHIDREAAIEANDEEVEAIKWLVGSTEKNR